MTRKIALFCIIMAFMVSGCSWHIPFFGSKKVQEEEALVQDSSPVDEEPQYSGQSQNNAPAQNTNPYQQPTTDNNTYSQTYGQPTPVTGAFQAGQPYNPNPNYAMNAAPGYYGAAQTPAYNYQAQGLTAAQPAYGMTAAPGYSGTGNLAYGAYPEAQPMQAMTTAYGNGLESTLPGAIVESNPSGSSFFGTPANEGFSFSGIKRKVLFLISYPQHGLSTSPQDAFSQKIFQQLAAAPGINLIPREAVEQYSRTAQLYNLSLDTQARISQLGQELGAQAIILEKIHFSGNYNYMGGAYNTPTQQIELQLLDATTGYPVKSYNVNQATPGSEQVIGSLVGHVRMIDWSARVIQVENQRILINAGRMSGLQAGQNLRVYAKGSEIKDPGTKLSLGQAQGALKGTVKIVDFFGLDGAICEPLANGKFAQDDMVKAVE
ncbi:MAG: hypothetical protein JXR89_10390 [Deltaproteobacteria bacterium]|nr:hypothetical protein [Deltaproteobacteria bacterium]